jgi:hypothetical protein
MAGAEFQRFRNLDFRGFAELAKDATLSKYEKIGFPDSYRAGYEEAIFSDVSAKLTNLQRAHQLALDIGPECSDLPATMIELCERQRHESVLARDWHRIRLSLSSRP